MQFERLFKCRPGFPKPSPTHLLSGSSWLGRSGWILPPLSLHLRPKGLNIDQSNCIALGIFSISRMMEFLNPNSAGILKNPTNETSCLDIFWIFINEILKISISEIICLHGCKILLDYLCLNINKCKIVIKFNVWADSNFILATRENNYSTVRVVCMSFSQEKSTKLISEAIIWK